MRFFMGLGKRIQVEGVTKLEDKELLSILIGDDLVAGELL